MRSMRQYQQQQIITTTKNEEEEKKKLNKRQYDNGTWARVLVLFE